MALGCCHFVELGIEVEQMLIAPSDAGDQGKGVGGVPIAAEGTLKTWGGKEWPWNDRP